MSKVKVGAAFSDYVYFQQSPLFRSFRKGYENHETPLIRNFFIPFLIIISGVLLFGRLFFLQIISGDNFRALSDSNRTRTTVIHAPRGIIFDRNNIPLVYNMPGFREVLNGKAQFLNHEEANDLLAKNDSRLEIDSLRSYPLKDAEAHIVGYIGEVSQDELSLPEYASYKVGDVIGKDGIEQEYEHLLKGVDGEKLIEVDATGKAMRTLGQTDPIPGQNITLTIDSKLQQTVFTAMKDIKKGAAIVTTPTGEVLAMVSQPSFDPNLFTQGAQYHPDTVSSYTNLSQVLLDQDGQPLLDRAIAGVYPPGSTFKIVTAVAGLQDNVIDSKFTIQDNGILKVGDFSFANWYYTDYGKTEGQVDVVKAIKRSNDIFFYTLGQMLGVDTISNVAKKLGVGSKLGIDLQGEKTGLLPTREWKQNTLHEQWYLGDNYHYGIGQGYLLTTPLQVNAWTQAIANQGTLYTPHLLKSQSFPVRHDIAITTNNFDLVREGMIEACQTGGVAWPLFNFTVKNANLVGKIDGKNFLTPSGATDSASLKESVGISIACKTGTAQHGGETTLPHAWITLFAPAYNPQIVVTVLSESSGEGSNIAGPVAKQILENYFENSK